MSGRSGKDQVIIVGGQPRVNLLPPEVALRKKALSARRWLVALVVFVLLAMAGGYGLATVTALAAQSDLAAAQARTAQLLIEQMKYSDVTAVSGQVSAVKNARSVATSTEVLWNDYYMKIRDAIPADTTLSSFLVDGRAPWEPNAAPTDPLRLPRVATITFTVKSAAPFEVEPFIAKIAKIPGFADVTPDLLTKEDGVYSTQFTYALGADALSARFPVEGAAPQ